MLHDTTVPFEVPFEALSPWTRRSIARSRSMAVPAWGTYERRSSRGSLRQQGRTRSSASALGNCRLRPIAVTRCPSSSRASKIVAKPDRGEASPRINAAVTAASSLGPPVSSLSTEERFCTDGARIECCEQPRRSGSHSGSGREATLADAVSRMEASVGQASVLLNDRLSTLRRRWDAVALFPELQAARLDEVCAISDSMAAAAYHVQKWAGLLSVFTAGSASGAGTTVGAATAAGGASGSRLSRRPSRPLNSEGADEAFAVARCALPRLTVSVADAHKMLTLAIKRHGDGVEDRLRALGVQTSEVLGLVPHLEGLVKRMGQLNSTLQPTPAVAAARNAAVTTGSW